MALHKQQLNVTKGQLGHLYRQWVSGKFSDSNETGNEQFNVMFSLFGSLMDTFKEVEKQNKALQMSLKRKNKPDNYSIKEKKAIIKETRKTLLIKFWNLWNSSPLNKYFMPQARQLFALIFLLAFLTDLIFQFHQIKVS